MSAWQMRPVRVAWAALLALAACAVPGCTVVDRSPDAAPSRSAGASAASAAATGPACPWSAARAQQYIPETGRIRLVGACVAAADADGPGGWVYRGPAPSDRQNPFADGTAVAVLCVRPDAARYTDRDGHDSTVWFRIDGEFTGGTGQGWVPHAATGYADDSTQDRCQGV